jgi:pimeloyl-ACP methyl ester carboxylesterase
LPVLAFAVPPNSERILTPTYSYRLMSNFATRSYRRDLAGAHHPITLIAGASDELMQAGKYANAVHAVAPSVQVRLIAGVGHMGIVGDPSGVAVVADDVANAQTAS